MIKHMFSVAFTAALLTACGPKAEATKSEEAPVFSSSEAPRNDAVDTTPTTGDPGPTPGANSFTADQAKAAIEGQGYTTVGPLTQGADGVWVGKAAKGGAEHTVSVDYKGAVTAS